MRTWRVLTGLFAFVLFALIGSVLQKAYAAESLRFMTGESLKHNLSVCLQKSDAIAILDAEVKGGFEAAAELWNKSAQCGNTDVVGPTVGKVVHSAPVVRGEQKMTVSVVEIIGQSGEVMGYFLTSAKVEAKRDRNA